ncbi:oxidoreductase [Streptomyces sp. NPDC048350]|uniref:oxidoreductase n=1 Tax=Streptomyces sp. NPDC048350 TaxID=3365538 RepID=UPI003715060D
MSDRAIRAESGFRRDAVARAVAVAEDGARAADAERCVSARTLAALDEAGFARHFVPRRFGGREGTFADVFRATAEVARGCASAAWLGMLWSAHARFAALLPEEGRQDLWGASPDVRIAAGLTPPSGAAVPVDGGWLLGGEWPVVSGADHADWLLLCAPESPAAGPGAPNAPVPSADAVAGSGGPEDGAADDGGKPERPRFRVCAVPRSAVTVVDTWRSSGMRGTASHTVLLPATTVPAGRTVPFDVLVAGGPPDGRARCHTAPAHLAGGLLFSAPALGAARRALAEWSERLLPGAVPGTAGPAGSGPVGSGASPVREGQAARLARAWADVEAVALLLSEAVRRADTGEISPFAVARNRRDAAVGAERLAGAMDLLMGAGDADLPDMNGDLGRHLRDVRAVASHGALRVEGAAVAFADALPAAMEDRHRRHRLFA